MEKKFGIINKSGVLENAPRSLKYNGILYSNPSEQLYRDAGYKEIINNIPEQKDGFQTVMNGYTQDELCIYYNYEYVEIKVEPEQPVQETFEISKLHLRIALCKLGIWEKVEDWLRSFDIDLGGGMLINAYDAWRDALVLDTGSELFKPYLDMAKDKFKDIVSSDEVDQILLSCKAK